MLFNVNSLYLSEKTFGFMLISQYFLVTLYSENKSKTAWIQPIKILKKGSRWKRNT